jgi:hypothetical protein
VAAVCCVLQLMVKVCADKVVRCAVAVCVLRLAANGESMCR